MVGDPFGSHFAGVLHFGGISLRLISVVPARSGSKSIRDKNLQRIRGHSLIAWAVTIASNISGSTTFIDTDSPVYAAEATKYGALVPFLRRPELALDSTSDTQMFAEFTNRMGLNDDTAIIHLRPTTPLRNNEVVKMALEKFWSNSSLCFSLRSVHEMPESAYKSVELDANGILQPLHGLVETTEQANQPRQSFPTTYSANGYVDIFKVSNLRQFRSIHGPKIQSLVTENTMEVDSVHELELIRLLAESNEFDTLVREMDRKVESV